MADTDNFEETLKPLDINELMILAERRDFLADHMPTCPSCKDNQIQLINGLKPAKWRCRACGFWFMYEPSKAN